MTRRWRARAFRASAAVVAAMLCAAPMSAAAQEDCQQLVDQARLAYVDGSLDRVLALTAGCLTDKRSQEEAYGLRARALVALDRAAEAEQALASVLALNPDFAPASDDTRRFTQLVTRMKRELARSATSSVSKMNESLLEAPATVVVVTAEQIKRRGYVDLEQLLHDLPGFDISRTNGQNYANIYQRGYRSDATNRTLLIVDGVEQNDLHSNIAHISRQYPLSNVDRVEVVYGPASTMYGANAFLGVINVITKEPEDLIPEGRSVGGDIQVSAGAWNSRYVDGTLAGRFRDATFSITGRAYRSDEWDLSRYPSWNYDPGIVLGSDKRYQQLVRFNSKPADDVNWMRQADTRALTSLGGKPLRYTDLTDDWMVSGKLKVSNFLAGFEAWRRREGATASATSLKEPGAENGDIWVPYQASGYVRYNTPLSSHLAFGYFGQAKVHGLGRGSASFSFNSYVAGPLTGDDIHFVPSFWGQTMVRQSSTQFRNELNVVYRRGDRLNVVGGIDLRNGLIQTDYAKSANCELPLSPFRNYAPQRASTLLDDIQNNFFLFFNYIDRLIGLLDGDPGAEPKCSPNESLVPLPLSSGGEHLAVRDIGLFAQTAYRPWPSVKLIGGVRVDHEAVDPSGGFGTVATPRLGVVYSSHGFVAKTVYSQAFKDPSSLEKYSTISGIRDQANPALRPEHAKNIEMSLGRTWQGLTADVSVFRTTYDSVISLTTRNVANDPEICVRDRSGDCVAGAVVDAAIATLDFLDSDIGSAREAAAIARLKQLFAGMSPTTFKYFFVDPYVSHQYANPGPLRVWGAQASVTGTIRGIDLFGNYTYASPHNVAPVDAFGQALGTRLRVADIATHHVNIGGSRRWRRFDGSVGANYVSARPTGAGTTVQSPLSRIAPYAIVRGALAYEVRPGVGVQLVVNNLFNTRYRDPGVGTADGVRFAPSVPQPGRSAFVRLLARF